MQFKLSISDNKKVNVENLITPEALEAVQEQILFDENYDRITESALRYRLWLEEHEYMKKIKKDTKKKLNG